MRIDEFADFDTDTEGYRIPRAHRLELNGCAECGKTKDLQVCGNQFFTDELCASCRKRWGYKWCMNCNMNHISGVCPIDGEKHPPMEGI